MSNEKFSYKNVTYPLLDKIDTPEQLRELPESSLKDVADEVRNFLVSSVSSSGGHFASGLGSVELTVALHYLYDTPHDRIVWDVGHQAYPHKILTGRKKRLETIRKTGGLAPFPKREESDYDTFGVGHSSTSISAALGMAIASKLKKKKRHCIAVIGDGAMTAGLAFEALNHAGDIEADMLVILNDNDMSISPNVGALSNRFAQILSGKIYTSLREGSKKVLKQMPSAWEAVRRTEEHVKGLVVPGTLFEEFGFNYIGPIDGHDIPALLATLKNLKKLKGPQFLHVITKKGKGYSLAEQDPVKYHGVSSFDPDEGIKSTEKKTSPTYSQVFGEWLCDMASADTKLVALTPAMREGSGLVKFEQLFPDRYFDVAIAEQHCVNVAAGMACEGLKPVVAIYSTFLQRAFDQLVHDVVNQSLPVLFAVDRAGVVGADGPTHNGSYDVSFIRCLPNIVIMAPSDENECRQMLYTGFRLSKPAVVRYPRGVGPGVEIEKEMNIIPIGESKTIFVGKSIAILSFGSVLDIAKDVASELNATLVDMRFIKPLDEKKLTEIGNSYDVIFTIEESVVEGGAGSAVNEFLLSEGSKACIFNYGLPDKLLAHGSREDMLIEAGLDRDNFHSFVRSKIELTKERLKR